MDSSHGDIIEAFARLGFASLLVDRAGAVLACSERADALWIEAFGRPAAADDGHREPLRAIVATATAASRPADCPPVTLPRPRGRVLIVHAVLVTGPGAILVLIDPEEIREPSAALLRSAFGLTRSEVDLAHHLCLGRALKDIARHRQTSVATLRVQLRALFTKTRTRRQAELVALLARLPPGLDPVSAA